MNVRACRCVLTSDKFIQRMMKIVTLVMNLKCMALEVKFKLAPKEANQRYKSSHFYSDVFRRPSSDLPFLFG